MECKGFLAVCGRWRISHLPGALFFYESVVRFGPAKASIFQVSSPLFTAVMAWALLSERLTLLAVLCMVMTIGGLILVSSKPGAFTRFSPLAQGMVAPDAVPVPVPVATNLTVGDRLLQSVLLLGLSSSLAYAIGNVLRGTAVRSWNEPMLGGLIGGVCELALHLMFTSGKRELLARLWSASRSGMGLYGLVGICTISGQILAIASMYYIPLSVTTLVTLCTPLLVFPLSHWLLKGREHITAITLAGSVLTLLGISLIVLR